MHYSEEIPQTQHIFAVFDPQKTGNSWEIPEETLVLDLSKKPLEHPGVIYSRLHEKIWKTSGIAGTFHLADLGGFMGFPWGFSFGSSRPIVLFV